jgi:hypothetical protein
MQAHHAKRGTPMTSVSITARLVCPSTSLADVRPFLDPGADPGILQMETLMRVLQ